jgi:hypothetical protein
VRIQRVVLEHHRDVALLGRDAIDDAVADADLAAGNLLEPGDHPQQRRLAAARRTDQHAELAVGDRDVDAADHVRRSEVFLYAGDGHLRHCASTPGIVVVVRARSRAGRAASLHQGLRVPAVTT